MGVPCDEAGCIMRVPLTPDCEPVASFTLEEGDAPAAAYAYCNLHGLWKNQSDFDRLCFPGKVPETSGQK